MNQPFYINIYIGRPIVSDIDGIDAGLVPTEAMTYVEEVKWNINNSKKDMKQNIDQI